MKIELGFDSGEEEDKDEDVVEMAMAVAKAAHAALSKGCCCLSFQLPRIHVRQLQIDCGWGPLRTVNNLHRWLTSALQCESLSGVFLLRVIKESMPLCC